MLKGSGALLRDIRNIKRNNTMTQKEILSSKQIKKVRSSEQINLNQFVELKNQKIKNIDERLQAHQGQIEKNNLIISELTNNFLNLKEQMMKEKQKTQNEQKKNKLLREEIERTNKILRTKNVKIDELCKKIQGYEKDSQNLKIANMKLDESIKSNVSLRKQIGILEQAVSEKKNILIEKDKQIQKNRQKSFVINNLKMQEDNLRFQLLEKDKDIEKLNLLITQRQRERNYQIGRNTLLEDKIDRTEKKLQAAEKRYQQLDKNNKSIKANYEISQNKLNAIESEQKIANLKLKSKEGFEVGLKTQIEELKQKYQEVQTKINLRNQQIYKKDQTIDKLNKKVKEFQNNSINYSKEIDELKSTQVKMEVFRKKSKILEDLYKAMVPQIQCPYGHELTNPVTVIPCGHNYCLGCKKGYTKDCMQCCGKLKIEAVYRNQLMDDLIGIISSIKQIMELIK